MLCEISYPELNQTWTSDHYSNKWNRCAHGRNLSPDCVFAYVTGLCGPPRALYIIMLDQKPNGVRSDLRPPLRSLSSAYTYATGASLGLP